MQLYAQVGCGGIHLQFVFKYIPRDLNGQTDLEVISCVSLYPKDYWRR